MDLQIIAKKALFFFSIETANSVMPIMLKTKPITKTNAKRIMLVESRAIVFVLLVNFVHVFYYFI